MNILSEIPQNDYVNRRRRRDEVTSPEEAIIAKRGRREMPRTPPKSRPPHSVASSVSSATSNQENDLFNSKPIQPNASPLTKCIDSLTPSPPRSSKPKAAYNLRRRLSAFHESSATITSHDYSPTKPHKLRRLDANNMVFHDSGIDMTSPPVLSEPQQITPVAPVIKTKAHVSLKPKQSQTFSTTLRKKNSKKSTTLSNLPRRRLLF